MDCFDFTVSEVHSLRGVMTRPPIHHGMTLLALLLLPFAPIAAQQLLDPGLAQMYFDEARAMCEREGGKLWGKSLCGPMIFVDVETHGLVANQPDAEGKLMQNGRVWVGTLPPDVNVSNTATSWAGVHWTMIEWSSLSPLASGRGTRSMAVPVNQYRTQRDNYG